MLSGSSSGVARLLEEADEPGAVARAGRGLSQLEASTLEGSVFAVRSHGRLIAATTRPDPTVGLVLYDLKRCLESLDEAALPDTSAGPAGNGGARRRTKPVSEAVANAEQKVDGSA